MGYVRRKIRSSTYVLRTKRTVREHRILKGIFVQCKDCKRDLCLYDSEFFLREKPYICLPSYYSTKDLIEKDNLEIACSCGLIVGKASQRYFLFLQRKVELQH